MPEEINFAAVIAARYLLSGKPEKQQSEIKKRIPMIWNPFLIKFAVFSVHYGKAVMLSSVTLSSRLIACAAKLKVLCRALTT